MEAVSRLYERKNFLSDIPYRVAVPIYEYDISKANINVLYREHAISLDDYNRLKLMSRMSRQVTVGLMSIQNPTILTILSNGLTKAKKELFESNRICDDEILSIRNDAIFIMGRKLQITQFDNVEFKLKNMYSIYMKVFETELYYRSDMVSGTDTFDVKGINDKLLYLHENGFIQILLDVFEQLECGSIQQSISVLSDYYDRYIQLQLPIEYYRAFDQYSTYIINTKPWKYRINSVTDIKCIDISYNMNFMRQIYGYLSFMYSGK